MHVPHHAAAAMAGAYLLLAAPALAAPDPTGTWLLEDGQSALQFYHCGDDLCGRLSWFKPGPDAPAPLATDTRNPNPALRARALCGLTFITGLKPSPDGLWRQGRIYNPKMGGSFDLDLTQISASHIVERGYKVVHFIGQTFTLTRAPADLPRCQP